MPTTKVRERVQLPLLINVDVTCPAGLAVGVTPSGSGCRCKIAHETITTGLNPRSLVAFCLADYKRCPTWQAEKDRIAEGRSAPLVTLDQIPVSER